MKTTKYHMAYISGMVTMMCLISSVSTATEVQWASTGHMTTDGRLEAGCHPQLYGLDADFLDIDANSNYVYALMTMVSHLQNGEISSGQMRWLYERAIMSAVPRNIINQYMDFDHRTAKLEEHMIGSGGDSIARVLLYDVTQLITYGDLYDEKPRSASTYYGIFDHASEQLGVPRIVADQIQDVVDHEVDLLDKKKIVFWADTPYVPPNVIDTSPVEEWAHTGHMTVDGRLVAGGHPQLYALEVDFLDIDANSNYVYALMTMASHLQNGELSSGQMRWLYERAIMSAVPRNIIDQYMDFDHRTAKLEEHMIGSGGDSIARVLLYDVTQLITYGDLYDEKPRSASTYHDLFDHASEQLGVPRDGAEQIQNLVDDEVYLLDKKTVIFWADTPYVPPNSEKPGDVNTDGIIDVVDLSILGANFGMANATFADGDLNNDSLVDIADLGILGANWTAAQATDTASALVPEPATLSLFLMSMLMVRRPQR